MPLKPFVRLMSSALGAKPMIARVPKGMLLAAVRAGMDCPSECRGSTLGDLAQRKPLMWAQLVSACFLKATPILAEHLLKAWLRNLAGALHPWLARRIEDAVERLFDSLNGTLLAAQSKV